jgi:hypothetical protein
VKKAASLYVTGERTRECKICCPEKRNYYWTLDWEKYIVLVKSLVMLIPNILKYVDVKKE